MSDKDNQVFKSDVSLQDRLLSDDGKYDFTGVDLETGEGAQLEFNSLEEMVAYTKAFNAMCDKMGVKITL